MCGYYLNYNNLVTLGNEGGVWRCVCECMCVFEIPEKFTQVQIIYSYTVYEVDKSFYS